MPFTSIIYWLLVKVQPIISGYVKRKNISFKPCHLAICHANFSFLSKQCIAYTLKSEKVTISGHFRYHCSVFEKHFRLHFILENISNFLFYLFLDFRKYTSQIANDGKLLCRIEDQKILLKVDGNSCKSGTVVDIVLYGLHNSFSKDPIIVQYKILCRAFLNCY